MNNISFKTRVRDEAISKAANYKAVLVDKEYLIYSTKFTHQKEYILVAHWNNYLHLVGINSLLSPLKFYD